MKNLKTYESFKDGNKKTAKFKIGDKVLLYVEKIKKDNQDSQNSQGSSDPEPEDKFATIFGYYNKGFPYGIYFYDETDKFYVKKNEIIKLLTPEEIEEYKDSKEAKKNMKKYNL